MTRWYAVPTIYILDPERFAEPRAGGRRLRIGGLLLLGCLQHARRGRPPVVRALRASRSTRARAHRVHALLDPTTTSSDTKRALSARPSRTWRCRSGTSTTGRCSRARWAEFVIKGPNVMKGYYNNPEATAAAIVDGWLKTGDVGMMDEEGYFFIVDRIKDMVNSAGLKIWPREVEEVLYQHEAVAECAVIGVPDPVFGENVKACIVLRAGASCVPMTVIVYCKSRLASYKAPKSVEFMDALPRALRARSSRPSCGGWPPTPIRRGGVMPAPPPVRGRRSGRRAVAPLAARVRAAGRSRAGLRERASGARAHPRVAADPVRSSPGIKERTGLAGRGLLRPLPARRADHGSRALPFRVTVDGRDDVAVGGAHPGLRLPGGAQPARSGSERGSGPPRRRALHALLRLAARGLRRLGRRALSAPMWISCAIPR